MPIIETDFEVWKAITARRTNESHSANDVLRELFGLPTSEREPTPLLTARMILQSSGRILGGRYLPDGTLLRSKYKGTMYHAMIEKGELIGYTGKQFRSASAAAKDITGTNVNGLAFWEVKRPDDDGWQKLVALPRFDR